MAFELIYEIAPVDELKGPNPKAEFHKVKVPLPHPLGPLADLPGKWVGTGFNQIWRPDHTGSDRFLELNLTTETLEFSKSIGDVPNRGFLQDDLTLHGVHYLQQVKDVTTGVGIHIEPGFWMTVPATTAPAEPATVVRMASIPHGTTVNAQGIVIDVAGGPLINPVSITPFPIGSPPPPNTSIAFPPFDEANLAIPTAFRFPNPIPAGITQDMVNNPNSVLVDAIKHQVIEHTIVLIISTQAPAAPPPPTSPQTGGGTDCARVPPAHRFKKGRRDMTVSTTIALNILTPELLHRMDS